MQDHWTSRFLESCVKLEILHFATLYVISFFLWS